MSRDDLDPIRSHPHERDAALSMLTSEQCAIRLDLETGIARLRRWSGPRLSVFGVILVPGHYTETPLFDRRVAAPREPDGERLATALKARKVERERREAAERAREREEGEAA